MQLPQTPDALQHGLLIISSRGKSSVPGNAMEGAGGGSELPGRSRLEAEGPIILDNIARDVYF